MGYFPTKIDLNRDFPPAGPGESTWLNVNTCVSTGKIDLTPGVYILYGKVHFDFNGATYYLITWDTVANRINDFKKRESNTYGVGTEDMNLSLTIAVTVTTNTTYFLSAQQGVNGWINGISYSATRIA